MKSSPRFYLLMILLLVPLVTGMGSLFGDEPAGKIPEPDEKQEALFVDQMGVATACRDVSIDGNTYIEGKRGSGTYTVPFDRIREIVFFMKEGVLKGVVSLKTGDSVELVLKSDRKAYGRTAYGTFRIPLGELRKMSFSPSNGGEKEKEK